jgi:PKD repeat protein
MRKLYALLAGLCLALSAIVPARAQQPTNDIANFTFSISAADNNVAFANTSVLGNLPGLRRAFWSFGDGSGQWTGPLQNTQHNYASAGTYTVCLRIFRYTSNTSDSVLSAQVCKTVTIEQVCRANFEYHDSIASTNPLRHIVRFWALPFHNANKRVTEVCWNFGDGTDTCIQYSNTNPAPNNLSIVHQYTQQGPFNVCVRIKYEGGCVAEKCKPVVLQHPPADTCTADFERTGLTTTNNQLHATFKAIPWHNNNKRPVLICWTFGDGRDTCIQYSTTFAGPYTVNHTYNNAGNYEVCVKILYQGGCEARKCRAVSVGAADSCRADFERLPVASTNNPLSVIYKALPAHSNNKKPKTICWTFGDGRDTCINYLNIYNGSYTVPHTYREPGLYEVCVKILYYGGCEARKCKPIQVGRPDSCAANFERIPIATTNNPLQVAYKALPAHNNNKKPKTICWKFGDGTDTCINYGQDYNGQYTVGHRYPQPGQYEVCVKILYYGGCEARKCKPVVIPHDTCGVRVHEVTPSITSLVRGLYAATSSLPPSPIQRICWNFGDDTDTCINASAANPPDQLIRHTYPAPGVYRACVRVFFANGCRAEDCEEVVIRSYNNICGGYMTDSLTAPRTFSFRGHSIHNPNDQPLSFRWTFGDGTTAVGREVSHTYQRAGEFDVCLYIKTALGCETRICKKVRVPGNNQPALVITPNPVHNILHALFFSTYTEPVTIKLVNQNGVVIRTITRNAVIGPNNWDFDVANLTPGVYSLVIQSANQQASAIFIKV